MKNFIKITFVAAFTVIAGYSVYTSQKTETIADLTLANVEALAGGEWGTGFNCRWSADYNICNGRGDQLGCPCGSEKW
ncbi:NVEALA domain-containing protein [Bacteroides sp. UBA939]|uniref:NVEALA domain-containing protein n=1 Tax=Bacteroides sp. UBA939 TaxID=1946092 RepID=UPI0025C19D2F|nr:NVEALA domain-containing protein [Bacteroides sp. UBA939]